MEFIQKLSRANASQPGEPQLTQPFIPTGCGIGGLCSRTDCWGLHPGAVEPFWTSRASSLHLSLCLPKTQKTLFPSCGKALEICGRSVVCKNMRCWFVSLAWNKSCFSTPSVTCPSYGSCEMSHRAYESSINAINTNPKSPLDFIGWIQSLQTSF